MKYKNIILLGTSHISKQSIEKIRELVEDKKPDLIAVELDKNRLQALLQKSKKNHLSFRAVRQVGVKGFAFAYFGSYVQKKLGKMVGVEPGEDMLTAVRLARKNHLLLALIDQDIEITLSRVSQELSWKERFRFLGDLVRGLLFQKRELKKWGLENVDLSKVPPQEIIEKFLKYIKKRYPNIYKVLIHERNMVMAKNLIVLSQKHPDKVILAVIGAGHEEDIIRLLKKYSEDAVPT